MTTTPGARLIAWAATLVPFTRRRTWQREWEAEVAYAWQRLHRDGPPSPLAVLRLRVRILTCVIDALWEKKETMKMTGLLNDIRFATRSLLRYPTFTAIAVLTLALGIGANTAVFTLVDGVLLSPLPFDDPEELVELRHLGREGRDALTMSTGLYALYREEVAAIEEIGLFSTYSGNAVNLVRDGEPTRVPVQVVTPSFFEVLEVEAALGRTFSEDEGAPDGERVVILSDGLWREFFGADASVIGEALDVNGTSRQIVGVMPPDFGYPDRSPRLWLPLVIDPPNEPLASFGSAGVARLAPGATIESVEVEIQGLIGRLAELFPDSGAPAFLEQVGLRVRPLPLREALVGNLSTTLWILLGTVGFVLLIACANVANLLIVRAEGRQRELALRVAVGAGRVQVLRSFLAESVVLAGAGAALAIAIATVAVRATVALVPTNLPRVTEIGFDVRVLAFTGAIALGCALFFGFFPLLRYGSADLGTQLRDGASHGSTGGRQGHRLRNTLVVVQMALALVLLVGSGLMLKSFQALRAVDPGFDAENVLTAQLSIPSGEIEGWAETAGFFRDLRERLEAQGGVEAAGFALSVPLDGGMGYYAVDVEDHPRAEGELPVFASNNQVEAGYLEAIGIELLEGRTLERGDGAEGIRSVVVSKGFADRYWPDRGAIGRRMRLFQGEEWFTIVGVVADAKYESLAGAAEEAVYWPATIGPADDPQPTRSMDVVIKTTSDPLGFVPLLRREVQAINPRIPVSEPTTMADRLDGATARTSFTMALLGAASSIALLLGLVGIYGVISYVVSQRTREIGVRMALGATAPTVRSMVVRQGLGLASIGAIVGLIGAAGMSRVMTSLLYEVSPTDPVTYGGVAVVLVTVAVVACWIPAMRAAGVDPSRALRSE